MHRGRTDMSPPGVDCVSTRLILAQQINRLVDFGV
jgi:hypothetical protein